jgi:hypothetical protein
MTPVFASQREGSVSRELTGKAGTAQMPRMLTDQQNPAKIKICGGIYK